METRSLSSICKTAIKVSIGTLSGIKSSTSRRLLDARTGLLGLVNSSNSRCSDLSPSKRGRLPLITSKRCVASTSPGETVVNPASAIACSSLLGIQRAGAPYTGSFTLRPAGVSAFSSGRSTKTLSCSSVSLACSTPNKRITYWPAGRPISSVSRTSGRMSPKD